MRDQRSLFLKGSIGATALISLLIAGCGGKGGDDTGETNTPNIGELPAYTPEAGVAYAAHYGSDSLNWVRTDGSTLRSVGEMALDGLTHDLDVDAINDLLVIVHDLERKVVLYQLDRPAGPNAQIADPVRLSEVSFDTGVYLARLDGYHNRLYAMTMAPSTDGSLVTETDMWVYDISDPTNPTLVSQGRVPASASWDIDPVRQLMFLYYSDDLTIFDLGGDRFAELAGSPISLKEWYPQENTWGFSARNVTVDPWSARVYAGRPQGTLSELMVVAYDDVVPGEGSSYRHLADMTTAQPVADGFDVDVDHEERVYMLEAHTALPDPQLGAVLLAGRAWNGSLSTDMVLPLDADLQIGAGCDSADDPFCWYQYINDGSASSYLMSEGAGCLDTTHRVFVGTTVDFEAEESPGYFMAFSYEESLEMAPFLSEDQGLITASAWPIDVVCH
jgi:hypothetical protein